MFRFALAIFWVVSTPFPVAVAAGGEIRGDLQSQPSATWPQWRGPERNGQVGGARWPDRLDKDSLELLWRIPLGPSYSGPVLSDDLVFTTATEDKKNEVVIALDRRTGKQQWRSEWQGALTVPFFAASNGSWIRSTPAYDGESLYVAGIRDVLVCLEASSGKELWRVDFAEKFKTSLPAFGFVSSPLVDGDDLYVQAGGSVCKVNKMTGEVLWRTLEDGGGMSGSAFSSPMMARLAGKRQLVAQTREKLVGVDLDSGGVLWTQVVPSFRGMNIITPVLVGDAVFTSSYQNRSWLYRISANEGEFSVTEAWNNNAQGYMSTPVVIGGHAYLHLQNQRFTCINLQTGERTWTSPPFGKYCSLVAQGDQILALDQRGELMLLRANPEKFELLGSVPVGEAETWAHLAVSNDEIFVRELNALAAYRWRPISPPK